MPAAQLIRSLIQARGATRPRQSFVAHRWHPILSAWLLVGLLSGLSGFCQTVRIVDPGLETAIRETLGQFDHELTLAELEQVIFLDAPSRGIQTIDGLEGAKNLEDLDLRFNSLAGLALPGGWTKISTLRLQGNGLTRITAAESLPALRWLEGSENEISDVSFLKNTPAMYYLDLSYNELTSFDLNAELNALETLDLGYNQIHDLGFLARLPKLRTLTMDDNGLVRFDPPSSLPNLTHLSLQVNRVTDLAFLQSFPNLESLDLASNFAVDLVLPAGLTRLKVLNLGENRLTNVVFSPDMSALEWLLLDDNRLTELPQISDLTGLRVLDLGINQLKEIRIPPTLTNLTELITRFNPLRLVSLPENLATNQLASTVEELQSRGITVEIYPAPHVPPQLNVEISEDGRGLLSLRAAPGIYEIWRSENLQTWKLERLSTNETGEVRWPLAFDSPAAFYTTRVR